jgi:LmbE family N-acetylglucosaminyl deacetylase
MRHRTAASLPQILALCLAMSSTSVTTAAAAAAGPPPQKSAGEIALGLRKLGVVGSVLYVAAHPDDENTSLLAYLANGALARTAYLSVTRGDGGQNLIGSEQGAELGVIRTQELLAARRVDGAEQFFTRARDFGYSKSPDETLRIWGKDAVLADMVYVIRRFRPDVIVTRFSPLPSDTHGHHTASAMLALEAFRAAADPAFHPEQLNGPGAVEPWQARRLLWNLSSWGIKPGDDLSGFIKLDVGGYNPLLGVSYGEMAADSRSMHKSQGFGVARARGPIAEYFKVLAETEPRGAAQGLLAGVDLSWPRFRFRGAAHLQALIDRAVKELDPSAPHRVIPALLAIDAALDGVPDPSWRAEKKREVRDLVCACAGLFAEATAADYRVAPGSDLDVTANLLVRAPVPVAVTEVRFPTGVVAGPHAGAAVEIKQTIRVPADAALTTPYWLETPPAPGLFQVADASLIGNPESEPALHVDFRFTVEGHPFALSRAVSFKWTDPVMGERYRPVEVTPPVSVRPDASVLLVPDGAVRALGVRLTAGAAASGTVHPELPPGWSSEPASAPFSLPAKGSETSVVFRIRHAPGAVAAALRVIADVEGAHLGRGVVRIEHDHIPIQALLADAEVRLVPLALATGGTKIGYIPGPGDEVPASLRAVGYDVALVDEETLASGGAPALARFDAVVVGVRAFNRSERLRAAHAALMAYVEAGGTLVVQYNTNNRLAPLSTPIGPYPFEIGRDRVTDETATVIFAGGDQPLLSQPNKITARDFEGWVQERGLYFAEKWDPRYQAPLTMHDPGEAPLAGALLVAHHGKGTFVYTGLAFFRQLPAGVPGAFRLFANLVAGGKPRHGNGDGR